MESRIEIEVVDSHTGGEPTRLVVGGFPEIPGETMADRLAWFNAEAEDLRKGLMLEPRGTDILVGALLTPPVTPGAVYGVIYFNNVGPLGMCGHGTIGLIESLRFLGRISAGEHRVDTPVGTITVWLEEDGKVTLENVASRRTLSSVSVELSSGQVVTGDVAYGGNWFFLTYDSPCDLVVANARQLTDYTQEIMDQLSAGGITGEGGHKIDHLEVFGPAVGAADSRNFVLCPGGAYDRSPCGTGTSAKLACLVADGKLKPGDVYRQESITGSVFEGSVRLVDGEIRPRISGYAHVTGVGRLIFDPKDPLRWGIPS